MVATPVMASAAADCKVNVPLVAVLIVQACSVTVNVNAPPENAKAEAATPVRSRAPADVIAKSPDVAVLIVQSCSVTVRVNAPPLKANAEAATPVRSRAPADVSVMSPDDAVVSVRFCPVLVTPNAPPEWVHVTAPVVVKVVATPVIANAAADSKVSVPLVAVLIVQFCSVTVSVNAPPLKAKSEAATPVRSKAPALVTATVPDEEV